jgi:hypothetical protein
MVGVAVGLAAPVKIAEQLVSLTQLDAGQATLEATFTIVVLQVVVPDTHVLTVQSLKGGVAVGLVGIALHTHVA